MTSCPSKLFSKLFGERVAKATTRPGNVDVLIVGAGPIGLLGAIALAQNGVSIRIVDKQPSFDIGQRGANIMPRSQEAFKFLGVLDDFLKVAGPGYGDMRLYDPEGKIVKDAVFRAKSEATPEIPIPNPIAIGQNTHVEILMKHLKALGVEVELGTEMVTFEQDDSGVNVSLKTGEREEKVRASFLLGTDGAKGITRRTAGIHFVGRTDETKAVIGDFELLEGGNSAPLDRSVSHTSSAVPFMRLNLTSSQLMHNFADENKNRIVARPVFEDEQIYFFLMTGPDLDTHRMATDPDYLHEELHRITKRPNLMISKIRHIAEWRLNERVADHFRADRVVIAGDAAHCHSPTGGQGINSGVQDVMNVTWRLASIVKGLSPLSLLDTYEQERIPVIREMLKMTSNLAQLVFKAGDDSAWNRPLSGRQLGVHYRWSSIVLDELREGEGELVLESTNIEPEDVYGSDTPGRLHAGDRAPDAPDLVHAETGEETKLFELFKPIYHTILVLDPAVLDDVLAVTGKYPDGSINVVVIAPQDSQTSSAKVEVYTDTRGHAHRAYSAGLGVKVVVVRPDGVVGGLLKGSEGVKKYFDKIFV
ncbi:hypothetical protein PENSPDRAFT_92107 [Peniophora sp. CONT]|nr:hypothetical protein PENSPDRAFT_92107 [Peniophora sp. CONT]